MVRIRCMLNLISHFTTTSLSLSNEKLTRSRSLRQSNCLQIRQVKLYCVSGLHHKRSLLADKKRLQRFAICTTSRITQTVSFCNWTRTDEVALNKMHLKNLFSVLFRRLLLQQTDYYLSWYTNCCWSLHQMTYYEEKYTLCIL